jgi:hypothetical protein
VSSFIKKIFGGRCLTACQTLFIRHGIGAGRRRGLHPPAIHGGQTSGPQQEGKKPRGQEGTLAASPVCEALIPEKNGQAENCFNPAAWGLAGGYFLRQPNTLLLDG